MDFVIETPRLILRPFTADDADSLFELNSDPEVMRYLTGGLPTPRAEIENAIIPFHIAEYARLGRFGTWAAETAGGGEFLGWFHLRPGERGSDDVSNVELGYRLRRAVWGQGLATEGSRALIDLGFTELGVRRVFAHTMTVNAASRRVMEKCGLSFVRTIPYRGDFPIVGREQGEVEYAVTKPAWEARRGA